MRNRLIGTALALAAAPTLIAAPSMAEGPLNVTTYGGAFARTVEEAYVKPFTEATLDEYFGIDRAALEAEAKDATPGPTLDKGN